ncbi:MAG: 4Fe-4S binding protein [Anaerolineales bacterium]|nr:4Fe-4S binding protein [Anaerolineales bacterium]
MNWIYGRRIRQAVQILTFAVYLYLFFAALLRWNIFHQANWFFRLDPLAAFAVMLADRAWIPQLGWALIRVCLTVLLGRVWCGWLCPLGTLLEWVRFPSALRRRARKHRLLAKQPEAEQSRGNTGFRAIKTILLLLILAMALFGNLTLLWLDPITLLTRVLTTAILPGLNYAVSAAERSLYLVPFLSPVVDWVEGGWRGIVLPVEQPVFAQNSLMAALFLSLLALNLLADRFWCRYLCPLGALLGLLSKVALFRPVIGSACVNCAKCARVCRLEAIETQPSYEIAPAECTICLDCLAACPKNGVNFAWHWWPAPWRESDPTRRQVLTSLAAGAASVAVLQTGIQAKQPDPHLLRPPGVEDEAQFLSLCLRCSLCMAVCPTSGLQPALWEAGLAGFWTPRLTPRLGYCDYGCNACGQVCPSQAIPLLALQDKRQMVIGLASVDRNRCLPWAYNTPCIVCEEMCPVPDKAVKLQREQVREIELQKPYVVADLCIGCGICEQHCPLAGEAGIRVYHRQ